jgi:ParB-like chromosome segregation protein Spo0J
MSWQVVDLRPHPSCARLGITVSASRLNALLELGEDAFLFPLIVTSTGIVIDGYARLEIARLQGRTAVECIEYDISEEEALRRLLLCHRPSAGLAPFNRIAIARGLETSLREKALQHQHAGGKDKGSSKLTEGDRLDVRSEVAAAAGVSVGNVSKVKQLMLTAAPQILQALRNGEVSIHRAWTWCKEAPDAQQEKLWLYQSQRGVKKTIHRLVSRHEPKGSRTAPGLSDLVKGLSALEASKLDPITVQRIRAPGMAVFLSDELHRVLGLREESTIT